MDISNPEFETMIDRTMDQQNSFVNLSMNNAQTVVNATNTIYRETPEFPRYIQITATVFYVFIFLLGVLGNLLVIVVVCLNRNMKTSVNMYLVNLCVADLLVLTVCMPTALVDVYGQDVWYFGEIMCKVVPFLENTVAHASVLTLIAISIERYRVVCKPLTVIRDDPIRNAKIVPLLWVISAFCNVPWQYIATFRDSKQLDGTPIKVCRIPIVLPWQKAYATLSFAIYFVIPFTVLLILYCRICYILHCTCDEINSLQNSSHTRYRKRLRAQVINIIFCLVLLFFLFHLPFRAITMWVTYEKKETLYNLGIEKYYNILYLGRIMFYLNHAINPIVYNFVSTKFRNALRSTMTRGNQRGSTMSSNRRGNYNTPFTRPRQSQVHLFDGECEDGKLVQNCVRTTSSSSSQRQNRNEFFPMYAHIIQKHGSDEKGVSKDSEEINILETRNN